LNADPLDLDKRRSGLPLRLVLSESIGCAVFLLIEADAFRNDVESDDDIDLAESEKPTRGAAASDTGAASYWIKLFSTVWINAFF
jgi:hypothetical protein